MSITQILGEKAIFKGAHMRLITNCARQTQELGEELGKGIKSPACLALSGELGAGKTCLAQGIMRGLGVKQVYLTSPSYTIINQYQSPKGLVFHCDFYRLASAEQAGELGWEEYLEQGIVLIEWPEKILAALGKAKFLHIKLKHLGEQERQIEFVPRGEKYRQLLQQLRVPLTTETTEKNVQTQSPL